MMLFLLSLHLNDKSCFVLAAKNQAEHQHATDSIPWLPALLSPLLIRVLLLLPRENGEEIEGERDRRGMGSFMKRKILLYTSPSNSFNW